MKSRKRVVVTVIMLQFFCLSSFAVEAQFDYTQILERVKKVASALAKFKAKNHDAYPETLESLVPRYLRNEDLRIQNASPIWTDMDRLIYLHREGYRDPVNGRKVVAVTAKIAGNDAYLFIDQDCVVRGLNGAAYQMMLARITYKEATKDHVPLK
jgi:hypothetical protein